MRRPGNGPVRRRRYNLRRIKVTWPYTVQEISQLLTVHKNAVTRWFKDGLLVDTSQRPYLIRGSDLVSYLSGRQTRRKQKCRLNEFYCFKCRAQRSAALDMVDIVIMSPSRLRLKALCSECCTAINKIQGTGKLPQIEASFDVMTLEGRHLIERAPPSLDRDKEPD